MKLKKTSVRSIITGFFALLAVAGAIFHQFGQGGSATASSSDAGPRAQIQELPVKGMVTMLDLGASSCIPCKMMAPILKALEKEYEGKAAIVFIDVWKDPNQAKKYGIRAIPTQIFFDAGGKEAYRHTGFMDKDSIVKKLRELGVG